MTAVFVRAGSATRAAQGNNGTRARSVRHVAATDFTPSMANGFLESMLTSLKQVVT